MLLLSSFPHYCGCKGSKKKRLAVFFRAYSKIYDYLCVNAKIGGISETKFAVPEGIAAIKKRELFCSPPNLHYLCPYIIIQKRDEN